MRSSSLPLISGSIRSRIEQVVLVRVDVTSTITTVGGEIDGETLGSKAAGDEIRKLAVVLHNEQAHATAFNRTRIRAALGRH